MRANNRGPQKRGPTTDSSSNAYDDSEMAVDGDELASEFIADVADVVGTSRTSHGDAVAQHQIAAELWTTYLRAAGKLVSGETVDADEVARLMMLLKTSRAATGGFALDDDRDAVGYAGIAGTCAVVEGKAASDETLVRGRTVGGDE